MFTMVVLSPSKEKFKIEKFKYTQPRYSRRGNDFAYQANAGFKQQSVRLREQAIPSRNTQVLFKMVRIGGYLAFF